MNVSEPKERAPYHLHSYIFYKLINHVNASYTHKCAQWRMKMNKKKTRWRSAIVCVVFCVFVFCHRDTQFAWTNYHFVGLDFIFMFCYQFICFFVVISLAYLPIAAQYQFTVFARMFGAHWINFFNSKYSIWSAFICEYMKFPLYIKCMCAIFGYIKFTFWDKLFIFIILKANSLWYMRFFFAHFFLLIFFC